MRGDADPPVARPAAGPDVARRTVGADPGHPLEAGLQRLHRHGEREHHQEHRIDPRHPRDQERRGPIARSSSSDCTITRPLRMKNTSTPAPPCWNSQCSQCRHRRERHRVAQHDVARQHPTQPVQAHQPPHAAQHRGAGLTSREKFRRRLHPIGHARDDRGQRPRWPLQREERPRMKRTALFAMILMASAAPRLAQNMSEPTVRVGGQAMFPSKTIVANAVNSADHTTLVAAVKAAGLVDTLNGPGPVHRVRPNQRSVRHAAGRHRGQPGEAREQGDAHQDPDLSRRRRATTTATSCGR